ncbi:hypothetical protein PENSPDRAFT_85874 [Peniophora sp. CONT]|nr:hypothetical protein PENSPDRAFT_85874 [Peniophora sp. CONT]
MSSSVLISLSYPSPVHRCPMSVSVTLTHPARSTCITSIGENVRSLDARVPCLSLNPESETTSAVHLSQRAAGVDPCLRAATTPTTDTERRTTLADTKIPMTAYQRTIFSRPTFNRTLNGGGLRLSEAGSTFIESKVSAAHTVSATSTPPMLVPASMLLGSLLADRASFGLLEENYGCKAPRGSDLEYCAREAAHIVERYIQFNQCSSLLERQRIIGYVRRHRVR